MNNKFMEISERRREAILEKHKLSNGQTLEISLKYDTGGMNYFSSGMTQRGIYLNVTPISESFTENGCTIRSYTAYTGIRTLLKPLKRYSLKQLVECKIDKHTKKQCIDHVLGKIKSTIEE